MSADNELVEAMRATARRYEDTMGLTREGAIRRIGVLHDALIDYADRLASNHTTTPAADGARLADELEGLLPQIGVLPLAESWMYQAIRHCERNMDFDLYEGDAGNEPDRQSGTAIAKVLNALPRILAHLRQPGDISGGPEA